MRGSIEVGVGESLDIARKLRRFASLIRKLIPRLNQSYKQNSRILWDYSGRGHELGFPWLMASISWIDES